MVPENQLNISDPLHAKMCICANLQFQRAHELELSLGVFAEVLPSVLRLEYQGTRSMKDVYTREFVIKNEIKM